VRFSLRIRYAEPGHLARLVRAADEVGFDGVWVSEPWGYDAGPALGWCVANTERMLIGTHVASIFARTPAMTAGLAASLHTLSGGRFRLGLGVSGPAVVEGWHGVPFEKPVGRLRDVIRIVRLALSGEPLDYDGDVVRVPVPGRRPLRFAQAAGPVDVPIYVGALGPVSQRLVADEADGWTPTPYSPDRHDVFATDLERAMEKAGRRVRIAPVVPVAVSADLATAFDVERRWSAFYLGGMGEFYARAATAMGFGAMVDEVVAAWSVKDRAGARAALRPDYFDSIGLFGSVDRIRKRIERYAGAGADELVFELRKPDIDGQLDDLYALGGVL